MNDINQPNLNHPSSRPERYEEFQKDCLEKGFDYCLKKYGTMKLSEKIRRKLSPIKQKLKQYCPERYEEFQKDCLEKGFDYCLKKYGTMKLSEKIRRKLSPIKQKLKQYLKK